MTLIQEIIGAFTGQNRRDKNKEVVLGVLGGLTVGVIGALLLAPKSGKETRQDIKDCAGKAYDKAGDVAQLAYNKAQDLAELLKQHGQEALNTFTRQGRSLERKARITAREIGKGTGRTLDSIKASLEAEGETTGSEPTENDEV